MRKSYLICAVGDSRTFGAGASIGHDPVTLLKNRLQGLHPSAVFTVNNQAINGTTSKHWLHAGLLPPALASFTQSAHALPADRAVYVQIMLGVNDASGFGFGRCPLPAYIAQMHGLIAAIREAHLPGFAGVVLHQSYYAVPYRFAPEIDEQCIADVRKFNAALPALTNGQSVFMGDQEAYAHFERHPDLLFDGLHASDQGNADVAALWSKAYDAVLRR